MEIKLTIKEVFDIRASYKGYLLKIKAIGEEAKFNGAYIIEKVEEDDIYLYDIYSNMVRKISVDDFKRIREDYSHGAKFNMITLTKIEDL